MADETSSADAKAAKLEERIQKLEEELRTYRELGKGDKTELERKAAAIEAAAKKTDISGMSDAMGNELLEALRELKADVKELKERGALQHPAEEKKEKKPWSIF